MNIDTTTLVLCAVALAAVLAHGVLQQRRALARAQTHKALPIYEPAAAPAQASAWHALPGNVMELGASGFQIRLNASDTTHHFSLYSPEGCLCCNGFDMDAVKAFGEKLAGWRADMAATTPIDQPYPNS